MAKNTKGLAFALLLVVGLFFILVAFTEQSTASIAAEQATNCPNPQFAQNETISGINICNTISVPYVYIVNKTGTTITAFPTIKGLTRFSGTDATTVIQNAINNLPASLNTPSILFKAGSYPFSTNLNQKAVTLVGETITGTTLDFTTPSFSANASLTTTSGGLKDLTILTATNNNNVNNYFYTVTNTQAIVQNVKFRCTSIPFNTCGTAINETFAGSASSIVNTFLNIQTTGYFQSIFISPNAGRIFVNEIYCNSCNTVINDSGVGFNYFNGIDTTTKNIAVYLASGVQHDYINAIFNTTIPIVKDNSGQINYIETGQTGNVGCPALVAGVLTNKLGDKINVIWSIGNTVTTISQDSTNIFTSTVNIPVPVTVTLNAGETTKASQTVGVTETCFYN